MVGFQAVNMYSEKKNGKQKQNASKQTSQSKNKNIYFSPGTSTVDFDTLNLFSSDDVLDARSL